VEVAGVIEAVTPDHILVATPAQVEWAVTLRSLHAVVRSLPGDQ
jgi:hypothetical protein